MKIHIKENTRNTQQMQLGSAYWKQQARKPIFTKELAEFNKRKAEESRQRINEFKKFKKWAATKGKRLVEKSQKDYLTTSNDNTWIENRNPMVKASKHKNPHLTERSVRGAKAHAAWEKEHPNLTAWSYLPSAVVLGTALAPLGATAGSGIATLGDAAAATSAGQAITTGLTPLVTAASTNVAGAPLYTWADAVLSSIFGAHGIQTAINERGISPTTALEIAPLGRLAKPMWNTGKETAYNIADRYIFMPHSNSFTRGIGMTDAGLQDAVTTGVFRGNPRGTEVTAKQFTKLFERNRDNFRDIMDATGIEGIASKFQSRTLSETEFNAIKKAAKKYKMKRLSFDNGNISPIELSADPLYEYPDYASYMKSVNETIANVEKMPSRIASGEIKVNTELTPTVDGVPHGRPIEERFGPNSDYVGDGQPLSYWYDDGRNPLTRGHSYAKSNYGVRVNNLEDYTPFMHELHLHPSFFKTPQLADPNVEIFGKGPLGLTVKLDKETLQPVWKRDLSNMFKRTATAIENYRYPIGRPQVPENFLTVKPQVRTKVGDVEVNTPNMAYRQGNDLGRTYQKYKDVDASVAQHQIEYNLGQSLSARNGKPYINMEVALDKAIAEGTFNPAVGIEVDGHPAAFQDTPMYADGYLWYGTPKINEVLKSGSLQSGLLVTPKNDAFIIGSNKATPYKGTGSGVVKSKSGITTVTDNGGRLIPADTDNLGLELNNISAYTWEPGYGYRKVMKEPSTSLKFFERKPSKISEAERTGATKWERNFKPKWHVANYPGYLLKGLMKGSLLEKQLSKKGTININLLNAYFNKASQIEKDVTNKVLAEKFDGLKTIDYNLFKKAVLDELIGKYNRVPLTEWADYGIGRLGYNLKTIGENELPGLPDLIILGEPVHYTPPGTKADPINLSTFTFESPRISLGSDKHYDTSTLGHSRTYNTPDEPNVLHVMESLSDWGLTKLRDNAAPYTGNTKYLNDPAAYREFIDGHKRLLARMLENPSDYLAGAIEKQIANIKRHEAILKLMLGQGRGNPLVKYLHDNYLLRQLQENLRYAAENGLTKMRYPTPETAAKIEGYLKEPWAVDELGNAINPNDFWNFERAAQNPLAPLETLFDFPKGRGGFGYTPQHQTILKKYSDFPKLFLKLYKGLDVKTVTDTKGNTWYEVGVPKGYLNSEWLFKQGGKIL